MEAKQYATKKSIDHFRSQRKYLETNENKTHNDPKHMGWSKSNSKREIYSNKILPQETRELEREKQHKTKPSVSIRK